MTRETFKFRLLNILQSPLFLALIVTLVIIPFLPNTFDKYKTVLIDSDKVNDQQNNKMILYYNDFNNDGKSEKIIWLKNNNSTSFMIFDNNDGVLDQINFLTDITVVNSNLIFGDYDNNGLNEIYFFTQKEDSVFIQGFELLNQTTNSYRIIKRKFVDTIWKSSFGGKYDASIVPGKLINLNNDNYKEVVFTISTGFSLQPRNLYAYDIANDTIWKSPKSGSNIEAPVFFDLNNDGKIEIMSGNRATGNLPKDFPYSDNSAWLMVFDNKLNFFYEPVEFPLFNSNVNAVPYRIKDETFIAVLYQYTGKENKKPALYLYNTKGEKVKENIFLKENKKWFYYNIITLNSKERNRLYLIDKKGNIAQLNEEFETINQYKIESLFSSGPCFAFNIDGDTEEELIFFSEDLQKIIITRNNFKHTVTVDVPNSGSFSPTFTVKLNGDDKPNLSIQLGENWYLFTYLPNPLYYFKYLIYLGIYIGLSLFLYVTQKLRNIKLERYNKRLNIIVKERTEEIWQQKEEILTQINELIIKNEEINQQKEELISQRNKIEGQKETVEVKNRIITDSIRYAKRIQNAILTSDEYLNMTLNQHFILFKPKDIVSGDFYWVAKIEPGKGRNGETENVSGSPTYRFTDSVIIAAADCTGHGVPGAFMSMICNSLLNDIIIEKGITEADTILIELRKSIIKTLGQTGKEGEARDGMDIALCVIRTPPLSPPKEGTLSSHSPPGGVKGPPPLGGVRGGLGAGILEFSGANNPLYIVRKGISNSNITNTENIEYYGEDLVVFKPDKKSIGYEYKKDGNFTKHQIQLQKGDVIYIFSDGYADQLGGDHCKKFGYNRLKQLFTDISDKNMEEQKVILDKTIEAWKDHIDPYDNKPLEQMDDIMVIGVRF